MEFVLSQCLYDKIKYKNIVLAKLDDYDYYLSINDFSYNINLEDRIISIYNIKNYYFYNKFLNIDKLVNNNSFNIFKNVLLTLNIENLYQYLMLFDIKIFKQMVLTLYYKNIENQYYLELFNKIIKTHSLINICKDNIKFTLTYLRNDFQSNIIKSYKLNIQDIKEEKDETFQDIFNNNITSNIK